MAELLNCEAVPMIHCLSLLCHILIARPPNEKFAVQSPLPIYLDQYLPPESSQFSMPRLSRLDRIKNLLIVIHTDPVDPACFPSRRLLGS